MLAFAQAGVAQAQEAAATDDRVVVTGSRIERTGMTTPTPVTTVSATELQQIAPGNLIEVFDALPQFLGNNTPQQPGNFASSAGSANLNMRGLDSKRSLILLDGRRVVSANRLGTTDISVFPEAVIERVEVVTGGASAAYGTDAVAGVTNFILDTDFVGLEAKLQAGITTRGDNENLEASITMGRELGQRSHFIGSFEYYVEDEIRSYQGRDWYEGWGVVTNPAWTGPGDPNNPEELTARNVVSTQATFGGMFLAPGSALNRIHFLSDGTPTPFVRSALSKIDGGSNSQSIDPAFGGGSGDNVRADPGRKSAGSVSPNVERTSTYGYLDYDLSDNFTVFAQGIYGTNRVLARGGTTVMSSIWGGTIFRDNAYLPAQLNQILINEGRASVPFSRTHSSADLAIGTMQQTNKTLSLTGGFRYDFETDGMFDGWVANGYYQYGQNKNHIRLRRFVRTDRLFRALDAVRDPATGAIVCNVTLVGSDPNCVPINLFGAGRASQEAVDYVTGADRPDKDVFAKVTQHFAEISASGELHRGFGAGAISLALGASYRDDFFNQDIQPDDLVALSVTPNNAALGIRGVPPGHANRPIHQFSTAEDISGGFTVKEIFAETLVPLLSGVSLIEQLDFSGAVRWADYSGSGGIWAYKAGLDWNVTTDFRLRGTVSRDVRAGTLSERFDQQGQGATSRDPMFGNQPFAHTQIQGGNPNVDPEKADTITVGAVYRPSWFEGFDISVDWYDIKLKGAIDLLGTQRIIDDCFAGAQALCDLIERNADGTLRIVQNIYQNIDENRVNGVDVEMGYRTDVNLFGGGESLTARVLASFLTENSTTNAGAPPVDAAGQAPLFDTKFTGRVNYFRGPLGVWVQGRYLGDGIRNAMDVEGVDIDDNSVNAVFYTDVGLTYQIDRTMGGDWELFLNAQNVFDVEPPLSPTFLTGFFGANQTNEGAFDIIGRRVTVGVRASF